MATIPSIALPLFLIIASMAMLASSDPKIPSIPPESTSSQSSKNMIYDTQGIPECWSSFSKMDRCIYEIKIILQALAKGKGGEIINAPIGPICCYVIREIHAECWPPLLPDPFYPPEVEEYCDHPLVGKPRPPAAAPAEVPSLAPQVPLTPSDI